MAVAQKVAQAGEEGMAVADLRSAPAVPGEGLVGRGRQWGGVALHDGDRVAPAGQGQSGAQAGKPASHHHDVRHEATVPSGLLDGPPRA